MTRIRPALSLPRLAALALFLCAGVAQAQYVWVAPNGTRQYSDQPPPPGTPASKILKSPGRPAPAQITAPEAAATAAPKAATPAAAASAGEKKPSTLAERELDYQKRAKEREEAERKAQEEARMAAARAAQCADVQRAKRTYESGVRIAEMGPDGKQRFLSDAERAERTAKASSMLRECR